MTTEPPRRREIVLITKSEGGAPGPLDRIERLSRTVSILAIPVVLAAGGWWLQSELQDQAVKRDYVQLAVSVLQEPDTGKISAGLRSWATDLLNSSSPTRLPDALLEELRTGRARADARGGKTRMSDNATLAGVAGVAFWRRGTLLRGCWIGFQVGCSP